MAPRPRTPALRLRRAVADDLETLVRHRTAMWRAIGGNSEAALADEARSYRRWVARMLRERRLVGWIACDAQGAPVGSGCLWFAESQPRPREPQLFRPYLLSMYTEPAARGHGVASAIVEAAVELARRRGFGRITLHASEQGRPVYARLGFERSWEMRRILEENRVDPAAARNAPAGRRRGAPPSGR